MSKYGAATILALILVCALAKHAEAFGTINALGQHAEHEKITRGALYFLDPSTLDAIAGRAGRPGMSATMAFGAVGAPDRPGRGLISAPRAHCDGGDFLPPQLVDGDAPYPHLKKDAEAALIACRDWMFQNLDEAVAFSADLAAPTKENTAIDKCPFDGKTGSTKCRVLDALGLTLHAAQDFYSHTNWSDRAAPGPQGAQNPPGLHQITNAPFVAPPNRIAVPDGLISGCYEGFPEWAHCNYGGVGPVNAKHRVKHAVLNKDEGLIPPGEFKKIASDQFQYSSEVGAGDTERGAHDGNFASAVYAAMADTRLKWDYFEAALVQKYGDAEGKRIACVIKSDHFSKCPDFWGEYLKTCGPIREKLKAYVAQCQKSVDFDTWESSNGLHLMTGEECSNASDCPNAKMILLDSRDTPVGDAENWTRLCKDVAHDRSWRDRGETQVWCARIEYLPWRLNSCAAAVRNKLLHGTPVPEYVLDMTCGGLLAQ